MSAPDLGSAGGEAPLRETLFRAGASLFARGPTLGSTGNLSVRLEDVWVVVIPTGPSSGFLDPTEPALSSARGAHLSRERTTVGTPLHATSSARSDAAAHPHHGVAALREGLSAGRPSDRGPAVSEADIDRFVRAIEESEAAARFAQKPRGLPHPDLMDAQVDEPARAFARAS